MIEERLHGDDCTTHSCSSSGQGVGLCLGIHDPARQLGALKLRFPERMPPRTEARVVSPLPAIRRIVSAIRLWCAQARSRKELCELSDHQLSDIGLRRVDVGYGFPERFWYRDRD
jgi:uncharacterized protein YjiS (DUF1127 family)